MQTTNDKTDEEVLLAGTRAKYRVMVDAIESGPCSMCTGSGEVDTGSGLGTDCPGCDGYGYRVMTVQRDEMAALLDELSFSRRALIEIDTYLAHDPDVWRIVSVAKAGDVLCDVLGAEIIAAINASVPANLCARCSEPT